MSTGSVGPQHPKKLDFFVAGPSHRNKSRITDLAEKYLDFSNIKINTFTMGPKGESKIRTFVEITTKESTLKEKFAKILKGATYLIFPIPLIALAVKAVYRSQNEFYIEPATELQENSSFSQYPTKSVSTVVVDDYGKENYDTTTPQQPSSSTSTPAVDSKILDKIKKLNHQIDDLAIFLPEEPNDPKWEQLRSNDPNGHIKRISDLISEVNTLKASLPPDVAEKLVPDFSFPEGFTSPQPVETFKDQPVEEEEEEVLSDEDSFPDSIAGDLSGSDTEAPMPAAAPVEPDGQQPMGFLAFTEQPPMQPSAPVASSSSQVPLTENEILLNKLEEQTNKQTANFIRALSNCIETKERTITYELNENKLKITINKALSYKPVGLSVNIGPVIIADISNLDNGMKKICINEGINAKVGIGWASATIKPEVEAIINDNTTTTNIAIGPIKDNQTFDNYDNMYIYLQTNLQFLS